MNDCSVNEKNPVIHLYHILSNPHILLICEKEGEKSILHCCSTVELQVVDKEMICGSDEVAHNAPLVLPMLPQILLSAKQENDSTTRKDSDPPLAVCVLHCLTNCNY